MFKILYTRGWGCHELGGNDLLDDQGHELYLSYTNIYRILSLAQVIQFLSSNFVQGRTFLSSCPLRSYFVCIKFQGQISLWFLMPNEEGTCFS